MSHLFISELHLKKKLMLSSTSALRSGQRASDESLSHGTLSWSPKLPINLIWVRNLGTRSGKREDGDQNFAGATEPIHLDAIFAREQVYSLAHKSRKVYSLRDFWMRDHDVRTHFTGPHSRGKIFHFAGAGHRGILELWGGSLLYRDPSNMVQFCIR